MQKCVGVVTFRSGGRLALLLAAVFAAILVLTLAAGCGGGRSSSAEPPKSGSILAEATEYTGGVYPSLTCTADGWVVETHEAGGRDHIWYNVGRFGQGTSLSWVGDPIEHGAGNEPSVAMTDDGLLVWVHGARLGNGLWYEIGRLDKNSGAISWLHEPVEYDTGTWPSVQIFNDGTVLETHLSTAGSSPWYKVGKINTASNTIDFGGSVSLEGTTFLVSFKGTDKFMQVMNNGYRFGRVDAQNKTISWMGPVTASTSISTANTYNPKAGSNVEDRVRFGKVAMSSYLADDGRYRVVYVAEATSAESLYIGRGYVSGLDSDPRLDNISFDVLGSGEQPAVADSGSRVVEMHKGRLSKTLWYTTGAY